MGNAFLVALAQRGRPLTKRQLLLLSNYRSSGDASTMFAALGHAGYVDAVGTATLQITPLGLAALGDFEPLPKGKALREKVVADAGRMGGSFLNVLFNAYPNPVAKGEILERTAYKSSGDASTMFSRLSAAGYAVKVGKGQLRAADELFEE